MKATNYKLGRLEAIAGPYRTEPIQPTRANLNTNNVFDTKELAT